MADRRFSSDGLVMFAAGVVAGMVAGRLLPPVVAQAAGAARAAAGRDPFEGLIADHRIFVSLLSKMENTPPDAVFQRTQLFLRLKRRLGAHALAEEDVIYPLLHDEAKAAEDARHLYHEHADMKMHLYALEQLPKNDPQWVGRVRALKALIEEHARQEEEVDFPKVRKALDERRTKRMAGDLQREKALLL